MRYKIYIMLAVVLTVALTVLGIIGKASEALILGLGIALVLVLWFGYLSVVKPLSAISNGMDLLRSQDFGSRLRLTGQPDADKVVNIFNKMMSTMKSERLKLLEQNLFLTKLMDVSPLGIAICDFDEKIIEMNPICRQLMTPALEMVLKSMQRDETRIVRLASSQIYRCSRLWFMDSGFRRTFYIVEILTEEIIQSERKVFSTVVRTIGHEVNNTLGPVISVLESVSELEQLDDSVGSVIAGSKESCLNLVEFVRAYSGIVKLPAPMTEETDLSVELERMMPVFQNVVGKNVKIRFISGGEHVKLCVDMMLMERALVNIIKNAGESIGEKENGEITISLEGNLLRITDNGKGINEEVSAKLFTPFFSTKRPDRGLGLMLVADILRGHKATFSLGTESESGLTTFAIRFKK